MVRLIFYRQPMDLVSSHFKDMSVLPVCMTMASYLCLVPKEVRRRHQIPWNWSYRWLSAAIWVQGIELHILSRPGLLYLLSLFSLFFLFLFYFIYLVFQDRVSLYNPSCSGACFLALETRLALNSRDLPVSASWVLRLKGCATTPGSPALLQVTYLQCSGKTRL